VCPNTLFNLSYVYAMTGVSKVVERDIGIFGQ